MREEVQGYIFNGAFSNIYCSFSSNEQWEAVFPTGCRPYQLGFMSVRICESPFCPALCNHCYPCKSNCKWVSLLNLYIDDLSPSESCTGSVWSIKTRPSSQTSLITSWCFILQCAAFAYEENKLFPTESSCSTLSVICFHFLHTSVALLYRSFFFFEGSSPSPRFLSRPSNFFFPLQDKCLVEPCVFLPLHHNVFMMCLLCGLLVRVMVSTVEAGWVGHSYLGSIASTSDWSTPSPINLSPGPLLAALQPLCAAELCSSCNFLTLIRHNPC